MSSHSASLLEALDADELLLLGLKASAAGAGADAMAYLKLAVAKAPRHGKAQWALATEYAALGMADRASEHFGHAVALDPKQPVARFQYGLLRLTAGDVQGAENIWQPLDALPPEDPIRRFKQGLSHMVRDEFDAALAAIRAAASTPGVDAALRVDMEMTIQRIQQAQAGESAIQPPAVAKPPVEDVSAQSHLAMAVYARGGTAGRH